MVREEQDRRSRDELADVNAALARINAGSYGQCLACGGGIRSERLEAKPWARRCVACAERRDVDDGPAWTPLPGPLNLDRAADALAVLRDDPRVDAEELHVDCTDDVARLTGTLPSLDQRDVAVAILDDDLGFAEVRDLVRVDRTAWEHLRRTKGVREPERPEAEELFQGERASEDYHHAVQEGGSVMPPEHMTPSRGDTRD